MGVEKVANRTMKAELSHTVDEGMSVLRALRGVWKERSLSGKPKMVMLERIVVLTMLYACVAWAGDEAMWRKMDVLEMNV